jgi:hypothetical protein
MFNFYVASGNQPVRTHVLLSGSAFFHLQRFAMFRAVISSFFAVTSAKETF